MACGPDSVYQLIVSELWAGGRQLMGSGLQAAGGSGCHMVLGRWSCSHFAGQAAGTTSVQC